MAGVVAMVFVAMAQGGSVREQEARRLRAEQNLREVNALLGGNYKEMQASEQGLKLIRNRMSAQRDIVQGLADRVGGIEGEIAVVTRQVDELSRRLDALKGEYAEFVYRQWKDRRKNTATAFLLSAKDFNTATRRLAWLRSYNRARVNMGADIDSLSAALRVGLDTLGSRRAELEIVKSLQDEELSLLSGDEAAHSAALRELQKDRGKLEAQAKRERETIAAAQREIDRIIAAQVAANRNARTGADAALSGRFEDNKGHMPWPVGGAGTVIDHFGLNRMADGVSKESSGLSIAAPRGAEVRAIFEGKVTGVYNIGRFDRCISVRSGSYIVVYGNIAATNLKTGDAVATGQTIGRLNDGGDATEHSLLLQIWRETTPLDPEQWLRK
jgi:septal ring factor EnvC (AmiA/AmiB activator)